MCVNVCTREIQEIQTSALIQVNRDEMILRRFSEGANEKRFLFCVFYPLR